VGGGRNLTNTDREQRGKNPGRKWAVRVQGLSEKRSKILIVSRGKRNCARNANLWGREERGQGRNLGKIKFFDLRRATRAEHVLSGNA